MTFIAQYFPGPAMLWAMVHSVGNSTNCWMVLETKGSIRGIRIIGRMLDEGFVRWMYRSICRWGRGRSQRGREYGKQIVIITNHQTITPSHHHTHHSHHNQRHRHHHCRHHHHQRQRHRPHHPFLFKVSSEIAAPGRMALEALAAGASYSVSQQAVGG